MNTNSVYLDWNATAPILPAAADAMDRATRELWGNPSSLHRAGRQARAVLDETRERIAELLGGNARDVVLTSGGTEANNWALMSSSALVTSRLEHPSVTRVAEHLEQQGVPVNWLKTGPSGVVDVDEVEQAVRALPAPVTVALMAVNHETGVVQPTLEVAARVQALGARLHVDAVQWFGKGPWGALPPADTLSIAAHKIRGPKGIGALVFRGEPPAQLLYGGAQEQGLRPGTQSAALAAGFVEALKHARSGPERYQVLAPLRDRLEHELASFAEVNGTGSRLPHVSNLALHLFPGAEFVAAIDLAGVCVSSGSACSVGTAEPSEVIRAMYGRERALRAVRWSFGEETTEHEVTQAIAAARKILETAAL